MICCAHCKWNTEFLFVLTVTPVIWLVHFLISLAYLCSQLRRDYNCWLLIVSFLFWSQKNNWNRLKIDVVVRKCLDHTLFLTVRVLNSWLNDFISFRKICKRNFCNILSKQLTIVLMLSELNQEQKQFFYTKKKLLILTLTMVYSINSTFVDVILYVT